jgi:ribosomal protein L16 Arg81 hydroxylase
LQTLGKDRGYTERKEIESQQVHSIDEASTDQLIAALNQAATRPEAIEAEFSDISPESQKLVMEALTEAAPPESVVEDE